MAGGAVHAAPYPAAVALGQWAADCWHWVNGRAVLSRVPVADLEGSDAFDVLHVLYEDYLIAHSREHLILRANIRTAIHEKLYGIPYRYAVPEEDSPNGARPTTADGAELPSHMSSKPFVAPTDPSQLSGIVGQPLE